MRKVRTNTLITLMLIAGVLIFVGDLVAEQNQKRQTNDGEETEAVWEGSQAGESKTLTLKGLEYTFRWCPAGTFMMGSPEDEKNRGNDESQHSVTLSRGFWMLETEVTQKMWRSVMGDNPSEFKGDNLPVECVSWYDCLKFTRRLNQEDGIPSGYRLRMPTEAQWEYACRAGSTGAYGGTDDLAALGWYDGNSKNKTHEVRGMQPNAWGLYDMHGNVWEWCLDWYGDYGELPATDPRSSASGTDRVYRGGSWYSHTWDCRSANRNSYVPTYRHNYLGLRLVLIQR